MKTTLLAALVVIAPAATAAADPPHRNDPPLRALWSAPSAPMPQAPTCTQFIRVDSPITFQVTTIVNHFPPSSATIVTQSTSVLTGLTGPLQSAAAAEDWLIELFIRINELDVTLADVPLGPTGARDCAAWNALLIQARQGSHGR
jgi:hypothetical protein